MFKKLSAVALGFLVLSGFADAQKRKITVMDFGYATVKTTVAAVFGTDQDIGKGISDQLITQLLNGGDFRIIERSALEKVLKEQNFSNSNRADPASAAKIGGLLGVDAIIIGDITSFGTDDKHIGAGGGGGTWYGRGGFGGLGINKNKTIVEINARIVDVNTGEILAAVSGRGETQKSGLGLGGGGSSGWGRGGAGGMDMGSSNFAESEIGKAVKIAVTDLATNLDNKSATLPPVVGPPPVVLPPLDGVVADAAAGEIIINVGSKNGVKVGETLSISRVSRVIKDPVTGKVIHTVEAPIGLLNVTSVEEESAVGKFAGTGVPKVGDHIKRPTGN